MSTTIDDLRRKMIAAGIYSDQAAIAAGLAADYAMEAYKQGFNNGFKDGVDWEQNKPSKQPSSHASSQAAPVLSCSYNQGDLVDTPLGEAYIRTPPDEHGNCKIQLVTTREVCSSSTFQFTSIIRKHTS